MNNQGWYSFACGIITGAAIVYLLMTHVKFV